jgi:hypothetical protein
MASNPHIFSQKFVLAVHLPARDIFPTHVIIIIIIIITTIIIIILDLTTVLILKLKNI